MLDKQSQEIDAFDDESKRLGLSAELITSNGDQVNPAVSCKSIGKLLATW